MSGQKKTSLARIRTYAQDLDEQRKKASPADAKAEVHTVTAEPVVVSKPKPLAPTYTPKVSQPESKTIFPPQEKTEKIETPHHDTEASLTPPTPLQAPKHIPAFHELQHELQNNINPKKPDTTPFSQPYDKPTHPKISVRNKPAVPAKDAIALSGGTVITDTKRADFSLIGAIIGSITEFFYSIADHFNKPKAPPKYTVTAPERRKGVIQKATSKTGTIFTADNETLKEEILRRRREQAAKPEISWSPNTEVGYPLLEEATPEPTNIPVVTEAPVSTPQFTVPEPVHTEPAPTEDDLRWSQRTYVPPAPPKIDIAPPPTPPVIIAPEPTIFVPPPLPVVTPTPPPVAELPAVTPQPTPTPVLATPKIKRSWFAGFKKSVRPANKESFGLSAINSNVIALTIIGVIAGVVILGFATRSLLLVLTPQTGEQVGEMKAPLIAADKNGTILFTPGSINSIEQIINAGVSTTGSGLTEIRFLDTNQVELSPQTLFSLFGFQTNPNFNQSVTTLRLLSLDAQARGFVFEVTDPTTVFGAMLEWERNMYADLGELLGLQVAQPESGRFIDRTIGQSDVRILVVNGQEVLIYGFIDSNVLLITSDSTQFTRVLQSR